MTIELTAYEVRSTEGWVIEPAESRREWMDQTPHKAANRCLPLVMANQAGWIIRNPVRFKAAWNPKQPDPGALALEFPEREKVYSKQIQSIFGSGIVTWSIPWLFRTSPGYGLIVRGPTNFFRPDAVPLDGFVESDWAPYTFTMNWKVMKPRTAIWFREGDPICHLMPYPVELLETVQPRIASLDENPQLKEDFEGWGAIRREQYRKGTPDKPAFSLDYVRGHYPDGEPVEKHRTGFKLPGFAPREDG